MLGLALTWPNLFLTFELHNFPRTEDVTGMPNFKKLT